MKHLKKSILGGAIVTALLLSGPALATPVNSVDGIDFSSGSVFQSAQVYESQVSGPNDTLSGYGMINSINGNTDYCTGGGYDCQLTFTFDNYSVTNLSPTKAVFSGGTVTFYAHNSRAFDAADPTTAALGSMFLTAQGHSFLATTGDTGTLVSTTTSGDFLSSQFQGNGSGFLDVTGGDAASYFATHTFTDNMGGFADIQFISDFSPNDCGNSGTSQPVCGSATVKASAVAVPEPGQLGMMGLGLAGFALLLIRRRKEKTTA